MRKKPAHTLSTRRVIESLLLFVLAFTVPWWCVFPYVAYLLSRYNAYEVIAAGILMDALYGGGETVIGTEYFITILFTTAALLAPHIKRGIIFYS